MKTSELPPQLQLVSASAGTKASIDWTQVHPAIMALAEGNDGGELHQVVPTWVKGAWESPLPAVPAWSHSSFIPGTCDWSDSLVLRPVEAKP